MPKKIGQALATGNACKPFRDHLAVERAKSPRPSSWAQVQSDFLNAMALFDVEVIAGRASEGERQNGKGDYFNDLVAIVLETASGRTLSTRKLVPGLIFPNHNLDVTYPGGKNDIAEVLVEAKMLGTPKHPGSGKQKAEGRPGSADLLKRAKELGFKTLDLKAGFGLKISLSGGSQPAPSGDLGAWSKASRPKTYFLAGIRVASESDLKSCIEMCMNMQKVLDGVGLFAYTSNHLTVPPTSYVPASYKGTTIPSGLDFTTVVHQIGNVLASLPVVP